MEVQQGATGQLMASLQPVIESLVLLSDCLSVPGTNTHRHVFVINEDNVLCMRASISQCVCIFVHVEPFLGYLYLHHLLGAEDLVLRLFLLGQVELVLPVPLLLLMQLLHFLNTQFAC